MKWKEQYGFDRVYTAEDPKIDGGDECAGVAIILSDKPRDLHTHRDH